MQVTTTELPRSTGEKIYLRAVERARAGGEGLSEWLGETPESVGVNLPRPESVPKQVWEGLSAESRCKAILSRWEKTTARGALRGLLDEEDFLKMVFPSSSFRGTALAARILSGTSWNERNPTLPEVIRYVETQLEAGEPLTLYVSQCIKKDPSIRAGKLDFFLRSRTEQRMPTRFSCGVETLGWERLQRLVQGLEYPTQCVLLLGDMDWFSMDGCSTWCSPGALDTLESEMQQLQRSTQSQADDYFGSGRVTVRRWTELYSAQEAEEELVRAQQIDRWRDPSIIDSSIQMYLKDWGYGALAREERIPEEALLNFIRGDCARTAAQYRVEANVLKARGGIQAWAERCPNRLWPLQISNYDGAGVPPTLFLLEEEARK